MTMKFLERSAEVTGEWIVKVPAKVKCYTRNKVFILMFPGLFLGLLCLVGGIIILIIFFVMKDSPEFRGQMFWIYSGAEIVILVGSIFASFAAFIQVA